MTFVRTLCTAALAVALTGCSLAGGNGDNDDETRTGTDQSTESGPITLVTHGSFALPKPLLKQFREETGRTLKVRAAGDAGELTTKLALSAGNPEGDVAFGVDNTFASRPLDEGVFAPTDVERPAGADTYDLDEGSDRMVPVDTGSVCVNVDTAWFRAKGLKPPENFDDLADPAYEDMFAVPGAATSSPGMAFLLATIDYYGDTWPTYWANLMANGAKLEKGWTEAYYTSFTFSGGDRPIVVSYDTSPAFTLNKAKSATTTAVLEGTCFRQTEYAGVLAGAVNPEGARQVVEFLLSPEVQQAIPDSMYMFPVRDDVDLPTDWEKYADQAADPIVMDPAEIADNREQWLTQWQDVTSR